MRQDEGQRSPRAPGAEDVADARDAAVAPIPMSVPIATVTRTPWSCVMALCLLDLVASVGAGTGLLPYTLTRFFDGDNKVNFPTGAKTVPLLTV